MVFIIDDFVRGKTEDKRIFFSYFLHDLHICTIHGSNGECTIKHELHITGTGCFLAGCRNLFGDICCRENHFRIRNSVILDEYHLDLSVDRRIVIDNISNGIDQLNGHLGIIVTGCCLRTKNEGSWIEIHLRIILQLVI